MAKVINLRGTSGSGKSHIVRRIMEHYPEKEVHRVGWRRQPLAYTYKRPEGAPLYVVGHYEGPCGGADNIVDGLDYIYSLIYIAASEGKDVIFEGLVVASDWERCVALHAYHTLLVIGLNTSLEECHASVNDRRLARQEATGKIQAPLKLGRNGKPKNTEAKYKALISQRAYFVGAKIDFRVLNREEAYDACRQFLELN